VPFLKADKTLRKSVFDADPAEVGEDLEISIEIGRMAIMVTHESSAICYEPAPTSLGEQ
jgi:hypothetical protein